MDALSHDRTQQEKRRIVDELFLRYENEIMRSPGDYACDHYDAYLIIRKEKR